MASSSHHRPLPATCPECDQVRRPCQAHCRLCRTTRDAQQVLARTVRDCPPWYRQKHRALQACAEAECPGSLPGGAVDQAFRQVMRSLAEVSAVCQGFHYSQSDCSLGRRGCAHKIYYHSPRKGPEHIVLDVPPGLYKVRTAAGRSYFVRVRDGEDVEVMDRDPTTSARIRRNQRDR